MENDDDDDIELPLPPVPPEPPIKNLSVDELAELTRQYDYHRGKIVFELIHRARADDPAAAKALRDLSEHPALRNDRIFHMVSLAWAAIIGLLGTEKPYTRQLAYDAFAKLEPKDQENLLFYLKCEKIEDAHPPAI